MENEEPQPKTAIVSSPERTQAIQLLNRVLKLMRDLQEFEVAGGSQFEADDRYLAHFGSSFQVHVVHRLLSVLDHLQLCFYTLAHLPHPLPFSQLSLVRSALAGASTALWVIAPAEIEQRRIRGLRLAFYDLEQYINFASAAVRDDIDLQSPERASELETFEENIGRFDEGKQEIYDELFALYRALGKTKVPSFDGFGKVNEVGVVREASETLHRLKLMKSNVHVELQYRVMSGFVHSCHWASQTGAKASFDVKSKDGDYTVETSSIEGNAQNILNAAKTALTVSELAAKRFAELARQPAAST
jgi:hypothetical protein